MEHLGLKWAEIAPEAGFWDQVPSWPGRRVLWLSRRSAREYAGFLEIVRRLDNRPADFIDISEADIVCGAPPRPNPTYRATLVSLLQPEAFLRPEVLQMRRPLTPAVRASYLVYLASPRRGKCSINRMERVVTRAANPDLENILHVVVGTSAAGSLIKGLRDAGRDESVACLQDDLSFAPNGVPRPEKPSGFRR